MLLDIFVTVPSLLMTNIAWYIHVGLVLICLILLFAVAIGAISAYRVREWDKENGFTRSGAKLPFRI